MQKVESDGEHTFVYVGALSALIIPRQRIIEGDYEIFVHELRKNVNDRRL